MAVTIRWVVMVCVASAVLGDAPLSDRPDITMLFRDSWQMCVAGSNTNGYGLTFMSETLENAYDTYLPVDLRTRVGFLQPTNNLNQIKCTSVVPLLLMYLGTDYETETEEEEIVCEFRSTYISCLATHVIHITFVNYGRNSIYRCTSPGYDQNTDCISNALELVRLRCEGLRRCTLEASNQIFGDPCPGVYKFLQVKYTCVLVPEFKYKDENGTTIDSSSDCDFEDYNGCWKKWKQNGINLQSSGLYPISPVTDERWNNFEVYRTVRQSDIINYDKKYIIVRENFFISISIRSARDAYILLCSTQYPRSSACYWIIIDGMKNYDITGIRKCVQGVPDKWAEQLDCKILRDNITIPEKLLDESKWTHFLLSREGSNRIRLWLWAVDAGARPLLDYTDDNPLPLSYMFVRSYNTIADWKVHKYQYAIILNNKSLMRLGPAFQFKHASSICVSFYTIMCAQCTVEIQLKNDVGEVQMKTSIEGDSNGPFMRWQNVRIQSAFTTSNDINYYLYVKLNTRNGAENNTFWAIDDFRKCVNNEIRVAQVYSYKKLVCQSLKHPGWLFNPLNKVENYNEPPICPDERYISQHCNISVLSVTSEEGQKICLSTKKGNNQGAACTCAAGFTWESHCKQECSNGYYGYNCKNKCGSCNNSVCNKRTGTCSNGCKKGYLPPYCQSLLPRLVSPPAIAQVFYTSVTVQFNDIRINGPEDMIHAIYLEKQKIYGQWVNCSEPMKLNFGHEVSITGLEKETTYLIRAVVYTNTGYAYRQDDVPTVEATTTCKVDREIYVIELSRRATISFETSIDNCILKRYTIELQQNGTQIKPPQIVWENMILSDLTPHTDYQLVLTNTRYSNYIKKKDFKTKQNAPGEIKNLNILETNDRAIIISWREPEEKNGIIQRYTVTYELIQRIECNDKLISKNGSLIVLPSEISNVTISDLQPYSTYLITVAAETILPGKPVGLHCNTTLLNVISEEELPQSIATSDLRARSVTINWPMNCTKQRGPLYFQILFKCVQNEWCDQIPDIILDNVTSLNARSTTYDLTPFTYYSVELRAKRSQSGDLTTFSKTIELSTPAASPPAVRNFTHYSKDNNSISLRWLDPYPPHGHLENYTIIYYYSENSKSIEITTTQLTSCNLWIKHFKCYVLTDLRSDMLYGVEITAKNKEFYVWGPEKSLRVFTAEDKPNRPLNLKQQWENNEINLYWNHPNITNGRLIKFIIILKQTESELAYKEEEQFYIYEHTILEEVKAYIYQIKKTYQYSTSYMLTVCGVNSYYGENATLYIDTSPKIPELTGDVIVDDQFTTDSTVTVIIPGVKRESKSLVSFLYVVVSKINTISKTNTKRKNGLKGEILKYSNYKHAWIAKEIIGINENKFKIFFGSEESHDSQQLNQKIINYKLEPSTGYEVTLVLINKYKNEYSYKAYYQNIWTASNSRSEFYALILLLFLPVVIYCLYRFIKKKKENTKATSTESDISVKNTYFEMTESKSMKTTSSILVDDTEEHTYETIQNLSSKNPVQQDTANDDLEVYTNI